MGHIIFIVASVSSLIFSISAYVISSGPYYNILICCFKMNPVYSLVSITQYNSISSNSSSSRNYFGDVYKYDEKKKKQNIIRRVCIRNALIVLNIMII